MKVWRCPVRTSLATVFEWCWSERGVDRLLLTALFDTSKKKPVLMHPSIDETVSFVFGSRLLERKLVRRWPGTELSYDKAVVYLIAFDRSLIKPMAKLGKRLEDWRHIHQPRLPEDPCLFREGDKWPVLISVTHEREAWIVSEQPPPYCLKKPSDLRPDDLMVPPAAKGFVGD